MSSWLPPRTLRAVAFALATLALACAGAAPRVPALVFVSRQPLADARVVPGLGPHGRTAAAGGRLMVRERDGRVRPLLSGAAMFDVSDPSVSPSGTWIAFAGKHRPEQPWRIWVCRADGAGLRAVTRSTDGDGDDLDPCWVSERALCFATTRDGERSQYADVPVTQLHRLDLDSGESRRITWERNGAEEPCFDRARDRIVYTRWWYNRWRPSRLDSLGVTTDPSRAMTADTVNLWQAVEVDPGGGGLRIAAGAFASRRSTMAYQPAVLADGALAAVYALNTGLSPGPGALGVQWFPGRFGVARRIAGAHLDDDDETGYGAPRGLAPPSACSPAALPDGRLVLSVDPGGRGDYGLWLATPDAARLERLLDLPGTHELDAAVLAPWPVRGGAARGMPPPEADPRAGAGTFTYECLNVFATGPVDGPVGAPPPLHWPLRIRFYTTHGRAAPSDSVELLATADVAADGSVVRPGLPAGVPLFEQLVDASGRPLMTAHGVAHVAGANFGPPGGTARCVGCHVGHSSLAAEARGAAFDAAPLARLDASSTAPGSSPRSAVDRRGRGPASQVAWVAGSSAHASLALAWPRALAIESVRVTLPAGGPVARAAMADLVVWRGARAVARRTLSLNRHRPGRAGLGGVVGDRVELRLLSTGSGHTAALAIAEIEIPARFASP